MARRMGWWLPIVLGSAPGVVCAGMAATPPSEAAAASAASVASPVKVQPLKLPPRDASAPPSK